MGWGGDRWLTAELIVWISRVSKLMSGICDPDAVMETLEPRYGSLRRRPKRVALGLPSGLGRSMAELEILIFGQAHRD